MAWRIVRLVLFAIAFTFVMINWHEIGHTVVARALGDSSAHYVLYSATATSSCVGCNVYDSAQLSDSANIIVNFGGVLFTQILALVAILLMASAPSRFVPSGMLWTVIVVTWLGDLIFQVAQGLATAVPVSLPRGPEMSYTDFTAIMWFAHDMTGLSVPTLRLILVVGAMLYSGLLALAVWWAVKRRRSSARESLQQPALAAR
jgi:hypothetical protein